MMWTITVTMTSGESKEIEVSPMDTVHTLKQRIQQKMGVAVQNQKLVFVNGCRTDLGDNTRPLSSYGMSSGSQVNLLVIPTPVVETFQVFLRNEKGKSTTYDVKPTETVEHFKKRVQSRQVVRADQMYLNYQGTPMSEDHRTLQSYGVHANATIELTLRLRGG